MKFKSLWMAAAFLAMGWAHSANAVVSTTAISWSGDCFDCVIDSQETSPAFATITVEGTVDPETDSSFTDFAGNLEILGLFYASELFAFSSTSIDEFVFLNLFGPLPTNGDSFISGFADFTLFFGETVEGTVSASFALNTFSDGSWFLCVESEGSCSEIANSDFGDSATFGAVPEPSGMALLGLGLLGLATIRSRRRAV